MNILPILKKAAWQSLFLILFASSSAFASNPLITRYFSGAWDQPDHESQGLILQIGEQRGDRKIGIAYWFTYGEDLQTAWYLGVGPINGNEINMTLYTAFNVSFMGENVEGDAHVEEIGTLDLIFENCNEGRAIFSTPEDIIGSGEFRIRSINRIFHSRCSGGISDDTPADARPVKLEVHLQPARDDISGEGEASFWERADRSDFRVEAEDVPDGSYQLEVCSEERGDILVSDGEGEIEFRSPESDSRPLLNFDPRDCRIELLDGDGVALTSGDAVLSAEEDDDDGESNDDGASDDHGASDSIEIEVDMDNTGEIDGAEGELRFAIDRDQHEFVIEVEHIPAGIYAVMVAGVNVGDIEVVEVESETAGRLIFTDPQKPETLLLDFDPRGEVVEVLQDGTVILDALFPDE
ncbi:MAG: hypothetical protein BMS9Abin30_1036 [Gammaproteobacteria bacterium]|nr:MAG: hypothetical protein BMS9Abin30_1036 [Gammaproteobacteria bacterium]